MLPKEHWKRLSHRSFEMLALDHVSDLYPDFDWHHTTWTHDGGRDAEAHIKGNGLSELYWMEAKHYPLRRLDKYTLDTHLVSVWNTKGKVRKLHVVTSGKLTRPFIYRASEFGKSHQFSFSYSDEPTVAAWLGLRSDIVQKYFSKEAATVSSQLGEQLRNIEPSGFFCKAGILPHADWIDSQVTIPSMLAPGRKYLLTIGLSFYLHKSGAPKDLLVRWMYDEESVDLLLPHRRIRSGIPLTEFFTSPVLAMPFRLLVSTRWSKIPPIQIISPDGQVLETISVGRHTPIDRLAPPLVGLQARNSLTLARRNLIENLGYGGTQILGVCGRAGCGKSRLAQEIRDEACRQGFTVQAVQFYNNQSANMQGWARLFRWFLGEKNNVFDLTELEALSNLDHVPVRAKELKSIRNFIVANDFSNELFQDEDSHSKLLFNLLETFLRQSGMAPILIHLEDVHLLSQQTMRPLFALHQFIQRERRSPFAILFTSRNDETVVHTAIDSFLRSMEADKSSASGLILLEDLSQADASELIETFFDRKGRALLRHNEITSLILDRTGTNPFAIVQFLDLLCRERGLLQMQKSGLVLLNSPTEFKRALTRTPMGIDKILSERLNGLKRVMGHSAINMLTAIALWGRPASKALIEKALDHRVSTQTIARLTTLGYLKAAQKGKLELVHDILRDKMLAQASRKKMVATHLVKALEGYERSPAQPEQLAWLFFHAGPKYFSKSWQHSAAVIKAARRSEDYKRVLDSLAVMERIETASSSHSNQHSITPTLRLIRGYANQHCGNTYQALADFSYLRKAMQHKIFDSRGDFIMYVSAIIEAGNQHLLRAEPEAAIRCCNNAIAILEDPPLNTPRKKALRPLSLALNRKGASLFFAGDITAAEHCFHQALEKARLGEEYYIQSHTLSDLSSVTRTRDREKSFEYLEESRRLWETHLKSKTRRKLMLNIAETFLSELARPSLTRRLHLYSLFVKALEQGFVFQANDALLCYSYCSIIQGEYGESLEAASRVLDLGTVAEDTVAMIFAYHYLSCSVQTDQIIVEEFASKAIEMLVDPMMEHSPLLKQLHENRSLAAIESGENAQKLKPIPYHRI